MDSSDFNTIMRRYSRYMLVIFNFFFVLTGVIIISVGLSVKGYYNEFTHVLDDKYFYFSDLLIVVGAIIFLIAFFGCCGAAKENACLTSTFSALLIVICILEALAGIGAVVLKNKTEGFLAETLRESLRLYHNESAGKEVTDTWDAIQEQMHCCGVVNYHDWFNKTLVPNGNNSLPMSCCDIPSGTFRTFTCDVNQPSFHNESCLDKFGDYIRDNTSSIEIAGITLALIQLLGIFFSCYLAKQIRSDYETV